MQAHQHAASHPVMSTRVTHDLTQNHAFDELCIAGGEKHLSVGSPGPPRGRLNVSRSAKGHIKDRLLLRRRLLQRHRHQGTLRMRDDTFPKM